MNSEEKKILFHNFLCKAQNQVKSTIQITIKPLWIVVEFTISQ